MQFGTLKMLLAQQIRAEADLEVQSRGEGKEGRSTALEMKTERKMLE